MQHKTFFRTVLLGLFVLVLTGCNNPDAKFAKVEGIITYNGTTVEGASVTFASADGASATGTTDANGKYTLTSSGAAGGGSGALPGDYTVIVKKTQTVSTPDPDEEALEKGQITYEQYQQRMAAKGPNAGTKITRTELLPKKYGEPTSELKATVVKGKNPSIDFALTD